MKLTIELNSSEVAGIKAYLKENDDRNDKVGIQQYVQGIVSGVIHAPQESVSDYIKQAETK